jgi:hypothetical protein
MEVSLVFNYSIERILSKEFILFIFPWKGNNILSLFYFPLLITITSICFHTQQNNNNKKKEIERSKAYEIQLAIGRAKMFYFGAGPS